MVPTPPFNNGKIFVLANHLKCIRVMIMVKVLQEVQLHILIQMDYLMMIRILVRHVDVEAIAITRVYHQMPDFSDDVTMDGMPTEYIDILGTMIILNP